MLRILRNLFAPSRADAVLIRKIRALIAQFAGLNESDLRRAGKSRDLVTLFAVTAVFASRVLGQNLFDVQFQGALALTRGSIAEMQTGEGKTLTAVPAAAWCA